MAETEKAILAGGCFWGVQDLIRKLDGVTSTRVGYTGGDVPNATYRNHGTHAEAIEILVRSRPDLLPRPARVLLPDPRSDDARTVRATTCGASYRSAIYYLDDEQRRVAEDTIADVDASGLWPGKVVTEVAAGGAVLGGRARAPGLSASATPTDTPATSCAPAGSCRDAHRRPPDRICAHVCPRLLAAGSDCT